MQFNLPQSVVNIVQLFWSTDSSILYLKVQKKDGSFELLVYFRANYHWFLKNVIDIEETSICYAISGQNRMNYLFVTHKNNFELIEF